MRASRPDQLATRLPGLIAAGALDLREGAQARCSGTLLAPFTQLLHTLIYTIIKFYVNHCKGKFSRLLAKNHQRTANALPCRSLCECVQVSVCLRSIYHSLHHLLPAESCQRLPNKAGLPPTRANIEAWQAGPYTQQVPAVQQVPAGLRRQKQGIRRPQSAPARVEYQCVNRTHGSRSQSAPPMVLALLGLVLPGLRVGMKAFLSSPSLSCPASSIKGLSLAPDLMEPNMSAAKSQVERPAPVRGLTRNWSFNTSTMSRAVAGQLFVLG